MKKIVLNVPVFERSANSQTDDDVWMVAERTVKIASVRISVFMNVFCELRYAD